MGKIIRIVENPFQPFRLPYQAFAYEKNPYNFFGIGVPENMDDLKESVSESVKKIKETASESILEAKESTKKIVEEKVDEKINELFEN